MRRCFVALRIDPQARDALARLQRALHKIPRSAARRIRVVRPENLHVTVRFLGAVAEQQLGALQEALGEAAQTCQPPEAELAGVGAFPAITSPRVIFAALGKGRERVIEITQRVEEACMELGFNPDERSHVPHVTLARVERASRHGPLTAWLREAERGSLGGVVPGELVLFESELLPQGARYTALGEFAFQSRCPGG